MVRLVISIRGTVTECTTSPTPSCEKVVYQKVGAGFGNLPGDGSFNLQRRRWVKPFNPKTPAQQVRRSRFAAAVLAWRGLSVSEKAAWRDRGENRGLPGYQAFISAFLKG